MYALFRPQPVANVTRARRGRIELPHSPAAFCDGCPSRRLLRSHMKMAQREKLIYWIAAGAACAAGFLLRTIALGTESFSFDEIIQFQNSKLPLGQFLVQRWLQVDPPLNDVIAYIWQALLHAFAPAGEAEELFVRIPVFVFGVLTIPAIASAAKLAFGPPAGAIAAWLIAVNPYHIRYSQEARMYALAGLLASLAMLYLVKTLRPQARARDAVFLMIFLVLLFLTHYIALLALCAIALTAFILYLRRRKTTNPPAKYSFYGSAGALVLAIIFLLPHAYRYISGTGARSNREWIAQAGPPPLTDLLDLGRRFFVDSLDISTCWGSGLNGVATAAEYAGAAAFAVFIILMIWGSVRSSREGEPPGLRTILIIVCMSAPLVLFGISQFHPIFVPRYLFFLLPPMILLASRARSRILTIIICSIYAALTPSWIELRRKSQIGRAHV